MIGTESYLSSACLSHYPDLVNAHHGDAIYFLQKAQINHEAIHSVDRLIPLQSFIYLLEITARELNYPSLSLDLAHKQDINFLGPLTLMLYKAETVAEAIETIIKYFRVTVSGVSVEVTLLPDTLVISFNCNIPYIANSTQYQDYLLASSTNTIWELVGRKSPLRGCYFTRNNEGADRLSVYTKYFGCPIAFNQDKLCITLDNKILNESLSINDAIMVANLHTSSSAHSQFKDQVIEVMRFLLASGLADIETVARKLGYSTRTLQRRLNEHATSFAKILDEIRKQQSVRYLTDTNYRLTEVSTLLGYRNLSSFTRSFKRWYGSEPSQLRALNKPNASL
ncbi:AraC family transcriptional regulator [Alteromonadaceae bacterium M269]|nr:AraC family transcriptional regulator [Alteromonadaceae bacterium M269]